MIGLLIPMVMPHMQFLFVSTGICSPAYFTNAGMNASMHLIEKGANAGKWAVGWVSAAGKGNVIMFSTTAVGTAGKVGKVAGAVTKTMQIITTTTHQSCHKPAPSDGSKWGLTLPQLFVMGSGSESFGSKPDPNRPIHSVDYKKLMDYLDYNAAGFNAGNQRESLQKTGPEKFVSLVKKWADAIRKQMENQKSGNNEARDNTESTSSDFSNNNNQSNTRDASASSNTIDPMFQKPGNTIFDRHDSSTIEVQSTHPYRATLTNKPAKDTFPRNPY